MNKEIFLAKPEDGKQISQILESAAGNGMIEMSYTRRPDAYISYQKETGEARIYVQKDGEQIIQTCTMLVRDVYLGGQASRAGYICGLKKNHLYEGYAVNTVKLFNCFNDPTLDLTYCCVLKNNDTFRPMIEKNRKSLTVSQMAEFKTMMFNPSQKIKAPQNSFTFRQAKREDLDNLIKYLNEEGKKKDLFPVIKSLDQFENLKVEDFYLLLNNDEIIAAAALWDVSSYKQYTVKKYHWLMKVLRILNPLLTLLKYIKLPKENEPIKFPFISFLLCKDDDLNYFSIFLKEICKVASAKYGLVGLALPITHFAFSFMKKLKTVSFDSILYKLSFYNNEARASVKATIFTENALL